MYLDCCFIPAHVFLCVLVFVLKDRNVISPYDYDYEIIKFAWLDLTCLDLTYGGLWLSGLDAVRALFAKQAYHQCWKMRV